MTHRRPTRLPGRRPRRLPAPRRGTRPGPVARARPTSGAPAVVTQGGTLNIDFATYNPLSLVIKNQGWLEAALAPQGISVNWVKSAGSNKANEALLRQRHRCRLDGRFRGAPGPLQRLAHPGHRHLLAARVGRHRRARRLDHRIRRRPRRQAHRRDHRHRPLLLPAPGARGGRRAARQRDHREPPARRRLGGAPERLGRRVGGSRPDHGRRRGGGCQAAVPQRGLQQLRLPGCQRVVPGQQAGRGPDRGRHL